ncbi:Zn-dependent M28 family amino/carboxypeptidase [Rhodococcus sp. SMB37]|uniref:M28 family peptidase n=1 Tax=Rhodococcus sp. SMB37 TaxID=2512213 RepID=UPI00104AFCB5|nr:M28 family peptidase [Rhodococcus sp. SMB37]TCN52697.1 Zn-dependent M28 family amino/carboxypeptidase [Rhodococcus sp. SMB37]
MDTAAPAAARALPRRSSLLALLALLFVGLAAALLHSSPTPLGTDAPADVFSAGRAATHIEAVSAEPRVLGTPAHSAAREYLVGELEALGWRTSVKSGVGWYSPSDGATQRGARVHNIVALYPGTDPTGTVVLAAHYDTVRGSPGAADDGIGIGTVLEAARAITTGPAPRNDVMVLMTDGEEDGLLGSHMFTQTRSPSLGPTVVLNHEARGNAGVPVTFRITDPNGALIEALAHAPGASADSLTQLGFELLPNDTDFKYFADAGFHAYDTAIAGGSAYYHSPLDTPDRLSQESLQQMGDTTLTVARELVESDLTTLDSGGEEVVTAAAWGLIHYPRWLEIALTSLFVVGVGWLVVARIRRGDATYWNVATATGISAVTVGIAAFAAWLPWWIAMRIAPGMSSPVTAEPFRPGVYQLAAVLAAAGVLVTAYLWARARIPAASFAVGAFVLIALTAVIALPFVGAASVLVLPALPALAGMQIARFLTDRPPLPVIAVAVGAVPAAVLLVPAVVMSFDAGLMFGAPLAGVFVGVLFSLTLMLWEAVLPSSATRVGRVSVTQMAGTAAIASVLVCALVAGYLNRDGATDPRQEHLWYALDSDRDSAIWASPDSPRSEWSRELLVDPASPLPAEFPWRDEPMAHGPAPVAPLQAPEMEVLDDTAAGGARELRLRLSSPRGANAIGLWVDSTTATVHGATVDGHRAEPADNFGFRFWAAGPEGVEVTLTLSVLEDQVGLRIIDLSDDLSVVPGYEPPTDQVVMAPTVVVTRSLRI